MQDVGNSPLSALFELAQQIVLPPNITSILKTYNTPPFVCILTLIVLHIPSLNVWRLIHAAHLEENHGCDIITTADIVDTLRHAHGDSPSSDSESESDGEPVHISSVSTAVRCG
jgi:hypothetical protein